MRGEEVQCIGIMKSMKLAYPCNFVALSSHTKVMYINEKQEIAASSTTISGQLFEAICNSTNIGKSLVPVEGEEPGAIRRKNSSKPQLAACGMPGLPALC